MSDRIEEAPTGERARRAANLFDLRRLIGGLFLIYGVILLILGIGASDADIDGTVRGAHAPTGPDAAALGGSETTRRRARRNRD